MSLKLKYTKERHKVPTIFYFLFAIITIVHSTYALYKGPIEAGDTLQYSRMADYLIANNFNYFELYKKDFNPDRLSSYYFFMYFGFPTIVALSKFIFTVNWQYSVLIFNLILYLLTFYLILIFVWKITKNISTLIYTSTICLISFETLLWANYICTDTSFMAIVYLILFLVTYSLYQKPNSFYLNTLLFSLVILSLFWRPAALPALMFFLIMLISKAFIRKNVNVRILFLMFITLTPIIFITLNYIRNGHTWIIEGEHWNFVNDRNYGFDNIFYNSPLDTILSPASYYILKFITYFSFITRDFSPIHIAVNTMFFIPIYIFSILAVYTFLSNSKLIEKTIVLAIFTTTIFILSYGLFHGIIAYTDYDWRYRLPIMPALIVLSSIGFYNLLLLKKEWKNNPH